jgi:hypothetical protein
MDEYIITEARVASERIEIVRSQRDAKRAAIAKQTSEETGRYNAVINDLESIKRERLADLWKQGEAFRTEADEQIEALYPAVHRFQHILKLIRIAKERLPAFTTDFEVEPHDRGTEYELVFLEEIVSTPFLRVRVYITGNDRPKNRYEVVVVGRSVFYSEDKLVALPRDYGLNVRTNRANVAFMLRVAPTVKELSKWWEVVRNRKQEWIKAHEELEAELKEVVDGKYDTKEWTLAYLDDRKDYYERYVSRGTDLPEYKAVLEQIDAL